PPRPVAAHTASRKITACPVTVRTRACCLPIRSRRPRPTRIEIARPHFRPPRPCRSPRAARQTGSEPIGGQSVLLDQLVEGAAILMRDARGQRDIAAGLGQKMTQIAFLELRDRLRLS